MRTVVIAVLLLVVAAGCSGSARSSPTATAAGVYLSLGDSVAAGNGASDKNTTSFVALLDADEGGLPLVNLAVAGATTRDVIDKQLPQIDAALAGREIAFITVSTGGNDLAALIPNAACQLDPLPASCPLDEALSAVERNLDSILAQLRARYAMAPIILLGYPNFFSGTGHAFEAPAARVLPRLDDVIAGVASRYELVTVANAAPAFEGKGGQLTHTLDAMFDPHPNDAGHRLIADAFLAALNGLR